MHINKTKLRLAMLKARIENSKQLAAAAGISVNTISRFLNGGSVTIPTVGKMAAALGVDPAELIEQEGA